MITLVTECFLKTVLSASVEPEIGIIKRVGCVGKLSLYITYHLMYLFIKDATLPGTVAENARNRTGLITR